MSASIIGSKNRRRSRSRGRGGSKNDFFVTMRDASGVNRTMMIWVPLAVLARNVVLENGGSDNVAQRASVAILRHGQEIDYDQRRLTVMRQVIVSGSKASDAVIQELGNGDVAAAVLQAVRYGGEVLVNAKEAGVVVASEDFESIQQPCLYAI